MATSADIIAKAPRIQSIQIGEASTNPYWFSDLAYLKIIVFDESTIAQHMVDTTKSWADLDTMTIIPFNSDE